MRRKRTYYIDDETANWIDQVALTTGKCKSDIVNNALRVQLALPIRYDAIQMRRLEELAQSILSVALKKF